MTDFFGEGSYFMSEEQKDAVVGRVVRERKETETRLALLEREAHNLGQNFSQLGQLLLSRPTSIVFGNQPSTPQQQVFNPAHFDIQGVVRLTEEIRETAKRYESLKLEAAKFGA
jgi:hypothetical protein